VIEDSTTQCLLFPDIWANRNSNTEKPVRDLLTKEMIIFQYTHGVRGSDRISPDFYTLTNSSSIVLAMRQKS
jgi:hypothetical protein